MRAAGVKRGKAGLILAAALAVIAGLDAGSAYAASETITGNAQNQFDKATYTSDQGEIVSLQVTGSSHNVTANATGPDGGALFSSATIAGGTTPVNGTQFLGQGSYSFICTIHPSSMQATLVKTGAGTPVPRPDIEVKLISKNLDKVVGKGKLVAQVRAITQSNDVAIEAKLGKTTLGEDDGLDLGAGTRKNVVLKLNRAARNRLAGKGRATVKVEGTVAFGAPDRAKGRLR
jgi:plastocyanin